LEGVTTYRLAGVDVPRIGLGTNRLTTAREHVTFIREAVAAGVRHIDTAHLYTGGESERAIGEALEGAAEDVLVATKGGYQPGEGRPEVLAAQIEQSLGSLRTDAIGLYYLHRVDPETPLEESLGAIKAYVDRGAIRHVGLSEVTVAQIGRAREIVPIAAVQNRYNLAERGHDDVIEFCERERIPFCAGTAGPAWRPPPSASASRRTPSSSPGCCTARPSSSRSRARSRSSTCARTSRRSSWTWATWTTLRPERYGGES
jgi:pyridoxine 4-dehydrogenase